jgi:hypothetical protein
MKQNTQHPKPITPLSELSGHDAAVKHSELIAATSSFLIALHFHPHPKEGSTALQTPPQKLHHSS